MPLGFPSLSHGTIAFGFFNIDTDLLLLEHYFLFATEFCHHISELAGEEAGESIAKEWEVFNIQKPGDIGDLMGAIHGSRFSGFIGEVYRRFPFPQKQEAFKQKPEGSLNRPVVEAMIAKYATKTHIPFRPEKGRGTVSIGEYLFTVDCFHRLIEYVWLGGYPRWRDAVRPACVLEMKEQVESSRNWLFRSMLLS